MSGSSSALEGRIRVGSASGGSEEISLLQKRKGKIDQDSLLYCMFGRSPGRWGERVTKNTVKGGQHAENMGGGGGGQINAGMLDARTEQKSVGGAAEKKAVNENQRTGRKQGQRKRWLNTDRTLSIRESRDSLRVQ